MKKSLSVLLILGSAYSFAQTKISGKVDNENNLPIKDVMVTLGDNIATVKTNKKGEFQFNSIQKGNYKLVLSYKDYSPLDTIISVDNNPIILDFKMKQNVTYLKGVTLVQHKNDNLKNTTSHTLSTKVLEKYSSKSLGDALQEVEGVSALRTGSNIVKPVINGLHSSRVAIYADNVRVEDQEWGSEHAPSVDVNNYNKVTVITGANALKYNGNAIGGMVLLQPEIPVKKDSLYGKTLLTYNTNGRGGSISTNLTNTYESGLYFGTTLTGKYLGDSQAPKYILSNTGIRNQDVNLRIGYDKIKYGFDASYSFYNSTVGILTASHIGNVTDLVSAINNHKPNYVGDFTYSIDNPKQEIQHHIAKINTYYKFDNLGKLDFQYAFQHNSRKEYDLRRGQYKNIPALDLVLNTQTANLDFESKKWNGVSFQTGLSGLYQTNKANPSTNVMPLIPDYNRYDFSAYGIFNYKPSSKLDFNAAVRYDYSYVEAFKYYLKTRWESLGYDKTFPQFYKSTVGSQILAYPKFNYSNISSSIGATYHINHYNSLIFNAGYLMRNPNPSELFSDGLHHSTGIIEIGNLGLKQEKALKASLSFKHEEENFQWDVTPYVNKINDFMQLVPSTIEYTIRGAFPVWKYVQNNALIFGIDANAQWNYNQNFSQRTAISYIHGRNTTDKEALIDMPPLNWVNSITYTNPRWNDFNVTLRNQTFFTQHNYPNYNFYTTVIEDGQSKDVLVDISTPPKGYSLFDISVGMDFSKMLHWEETGFNVSFSVDNLFNTTYRNYLNKQRFYADELGRNFMVQLRFNY